MLQARGFDATSDTYSRTPSSLTEDNLFPYGWRYVKRVLPTGKEIYDRIPLTAKDLLNPQLGDQVPQRDEHQQAIHDLMGSLKTYYAKDPTTGVFSDLIMDWGIPGLAKPAPDIAVVPHLKRKQIGRGTFKVADEGTRPCLVIEVTSPGYLGDDTDKVNIYAQAGIPEYFLIKPYLVQGVPHYKLLGYQLEAGRYRPIPAADVGPLFSHTLQLRFEVTHGGRRVTVTDLRTGQPLLTQVETEEARQQEQKARLDAEARAHAEASAHAQAEAARQQEQQARLDAEAKAHAEANARAKSEAARLAAEAQAQAEAQARMQLEQRLRELEALLKARS